MLAYLKRLSSRSRTRSADPVYKVRAAAIIRFPGSEKPFTSKPTSIQTRVEEGFLYGHTDRPLHGVPPHAVPAGGGMTTPRARRRRPANSRALGHVRSRANITSSKTEGIGEWTDARRSRRATEAPRRQEAKAMASKQEPATAYDVSPIGGPFAANDLGRHGRLSCGRPARLEGRARVVGAFLPTLVSVLSPPLCRAERPISGSKSSGTFSDVSIKPADLRP